MASTSHALLSQLIGTVRNLYHDIGTLDDVPSEVLATLITMRDAELRDAQDIKETLSGVPQHDSGSQDDTPVIGGEAEEVTLATVLSQFGTARETILSMLRELDDRGWQSPMADGTTIHNRIVAITERDEQAVQQIYRAAGKTVPVNTTEAG